MEGNGERRGAPTKTGNGMREEDGNLLPWREKRGQKLTLVSHCSLRKQFFTLSVS